MKEDEIDLNELVDVEGEVSVSVDDSPIVVSDPVKSEEPVLSSTPSNASPQYGAPQSLFEDIIPPDFRKDDLSSDADSSGKDKEADEKQAEKEAEAARKRAEKEAKKAEKEAKKKAKTAALIARVEADAVRQAKEDIKKESGEDYALPEEKSEPAVEDALEEFVEPEKKKEKEKKTSKKASDTKPSKGYSAAEKKLRKKYGLTNDLLLSGNTVIPGFVIAKGENVIRSYQCLAAPKGEGTLCLTNRRLLVDAGERSEVDIRNVSGIKFSRYSQFSFVKFFFWLVFFVIGFGLLATSILYSIGAEMPFVSVFLADHWADFLLYLLPAVSVIAIILSIPLFLTMVKKTFYFYVYAKEEAAFLECKSRGYAKREKKGKVYKFMVTKAGKESEKAARELGALIIEAKEGRYDFS